jgi:hypothetical protein
MVGNVGGDIKNHIMETYQHPVFRRQYVSLYEVCPFFDCSLNFKSSEIRDEEEEEEERRRRIGRKKKNKQQTMQLRANQASYSTSMS